MRSRIGRGALIAAGVVASIATMPGVANAVLSGTNGRIVMASGRNEASDATAKLYLRPVIGSVGGGTAEPIPTATGAGQHRHPTWAPDRTMIAYARGDNATANYDIYLLDLTDPNATPQNITNSNNVTDDRPAWSPDGTRIAFESENTDASGQINIKIYNVETGNITNFTSVNAATYEHKPAWTPDSQTLYYTTGNPQGDDTMDIVRQPADGSAAASNVVASPAVNEFQPSISPDGTEMCFTRGDGAGFNSTARVIYALANGGGQTELPGTVGVASYNCTWSPDGTQIAYVQGTFSTGDLLMEDSDPLPPLGLIPLESTLNRFDGNPDWAPDGRPACEDTTIETLKDTPVSIPLDCEDTGPEYEQTDLTAFPLSDTGPANGTLSPTDPQPLPASVTYTPNPGFVGTDTFDVRSFDEVAFGDEDGTVTVNVKAPNDFSFGKVKKNKRKGTAKLTVNVPGPGDVELAKSKKLKGAEKRANSEGSVKLKLRARGNAKRKLADQGAVKVKAKVTFAPDGGDPSTKSKRVKLKRR